MMSLLDYANDVSLSIEEVKKLCDKIGISYDNEESLLTEDDIILLDNEMQDREDYVNDSEDDLDEVYEEEVMDKAEELASLTNIDLDNQQSFQKVKNRAAKKQEVKTNFMKERKKIYKHREKLQSNGDFINSIKILNNENNDKTLSSILEIVNKALLPYDRITTQKGEFKPVKVENLENVVKYDEYVEDEKDNLKEYSQEIEGYPTFKFQFPKELGEYCKSSANVFEIKDGKARFISDHDRDYDFIAQASAKTGLDVTLSLDVINNSLMDIGVNGGINASANTIVHLYDEEGNKNQENINLSYDVVNEVAKENKDVKVCSDLSLNWYADLLFNSSKTYLFKHGLTKKLGLLDEDNQLFGNLHHIENGHFVKQCTRESRTRRGEVPEEINSDKLLLNKTAIILKENETYKFKFSYIPKDCKASDLLYEIEDANIVSVKNDTIYPLNKGNTRILIKSKDGKYQTYLKVLVSE